MREPVGQASCSAARTLCHPGGSGAEGCQVRGSGYPQEKSIELGLPEGRFASETAIYHFPVPSLRLGGAGLGTEWDLPNVCVTAHCVGCGGTQKLLPAFRWVLSRPRAERVRPRAPQDQQWHESTCLGFPTKQRKEKRPFSWPRAQPGSPEEVGTEGQGYLMRRWPVAQGSLGPPWPGPSLSVSEAPPQDPEDPL